MKVCNRCDTEKDLSEFSKHNSTRDGLRPYCKPCAVEIAINWQTKNRDRHIAYRRAVRLPSDDPDTRHARHIKRLYGLSPDQYREMLEAQGHVCAICGGSDTPRLSVDHCHQTERVRGLLCRRCNTGLGFFYDDPDLMSRAIA